MMSTQQTLQWQEVRDALGGQALQQMPFAQYLVYIGAVEGGVVQFAAPGAQAADRLRRRERLPALPRPVSGFVDRGQEQKLVGQGLALGQLVGVHGADGTGKTALVSQTMRTQLPTSFPDGRVYLSARHETREDLLQDLVESFYESGNGHVKLTENQARRYLDNKQALIAIDDANYLQEDEVKALAEVVPRCAVLVTSRKQLVWQRSSVELRGLPRDQAVRLFVQNGGPIPEQDRPAVEAICHALDDMPDLIIKAATIAAKRNVPLAELDRLPWELIYYPPDYLAASPRLSLVRFLDLPDTPSPQKTGLPLRVLFLPGDPSPSPGGAHERAQLLPALSEAREEGLVDVLAPQPATAAALGRGHVAHVSGRAGWEAGQGVLFFESGDSGAQPVSGRALAGLLLAAGVRLAVLSAAEPAGEAGDAWQAVARALVQAGLPAVVTIRRPMTAGIGPAFVAGLYRALARGRALDAATGEGRRAAMAALGPAWQAQADWALPALLTRVPEGQLWRFPDDAVETDSASRPGAPVIQQQVTALHDAVSIGAISGGRTSISLGGGAGGQGGDLDRMLAVAEAMALAEGRPFDDLLEVPYDLAALRSLLVAAFSPQELIRFCQEHRFLRPVIPEFSPQHGLNEMIDRVIGYCWTRALWDELLGAVEEENPAQYARFEPYLRAPPPESEVARAGGDPLSASLADLRQVVRDYAAADVRTEAAADVRAEAATEVRAEALAQVAALETAASGEPPDLEAMEAVLAWFEAEQPALAAAVLEAILSVEPRIQKLGDDVLLEFRARFRRRP